MASNSSGSLKLEIHTDDKSPGKWSVPLGDEVFRRFLNSGGALEIKAVFGEGTLFSPFLFGKYFDPSDAFPLWDFEAEVLLKSLRSLGQCRVDWSQTDLAFVLKSDLPVVAKNNVQVYVNGNVMEISGQWNINKKVAVNGDWRSGRWWEYGYVRRLELPGDADTKNAEAFLSNNDDFTFLEIRIPKIINSKNKF
ncbi:unnamed protein product [Cochlearia groenlandica]